MKFHCFLLLNVYDFYKKIHIYINNYKIFLINIYFLNLCCCKNQLIQKFHVVVNYFVEIVDFLMEDCFVLNEIHFEKF